MTSLDEQGRGMLIRASHAFRAGHTAEAIIAYEALLARHPALPDSWYNLGMLYRDARRFDDALAAFDEAIARGIRGAEEAYLQRGVILADDLADPAGARAALDAALALAPEYVPALLNLGNWHEDHGERAAAAVAYQRALRAMPDDALALARLIGVSEPGPALDAFVSQARRMLARAQLADTERADLGFALGAILDRAQDYDAAFASYVAANAASRSAAEAIEARYDRAAMTSLADRLIAAFPTAVAAAPSDRAPPVVFVCGMFRSGSTLAEHLLARHPGVVAGGEIDILPALIAEHLKPYPEAAGDADADILRAISDAYLAATGTRHPADTILIDKCNDNALHIGLIKRLLPRARIVYTRRDPRDTCLSVYFLHAGPGLPYATDLSEIAHYQREEARLMTHWLSLYPDDIFTLEYDRLVTDPVPELAALAAFCGLPDIPEAPQEAARSIRTASNWQVRRPLYRSSSGRWRHYARHLSAIEKELAS